MRARSVALAVMTLVPGVAWAQGAWLDPTFGDGGLVEIEWPGSALANAVAVDGDRRILVGGSATSPEYDMDFAVFRLHADGTLDTSYADGGFRLINFVADGSGPRARSWDTLAGLVVEDGDAIAVGTAQSNIHAGWKSKVALTKLDAAGSLDPNFGNDGRVLFNVGAPPAIDNGWALTTDARQRIVVAGRSAHYWGNTSQYDDWLSLARLTPRGQLDPTFAGRGANETMFRVPQLEYPRYTIYDNPGAVVLDEQGRIVVPGSLLSSVSDAVVFRALPDGHVDAGFGDDGLLRLQMPYGSAGAALPLDDGSMLVTGGNRVDVFTTGIFLEHVLKDGTTDPRFGVDGTGEIPLPEGVGGGALIAPAGDGGWLVAGPIGTGAADVCGLGVAVARFDASGIPDADFASNGLAMVELPDGRAFSPGGLALQPDGRLLVAGSICAGPGQVPHFAVIRIVIDAGITHRD